MKNITMPEDLPKNNIHGNGATVLNDKIALRTNFPSCERYAHLNKLLNLIRAASVI